MEFNHRSVSRRRRGDYRSLIPRRFIKLGILTMYLWPSHCSHSWAAAPMPVRGERDYEMPPHLIRKSAIHDDDTFNVGCLRSDRSQPAGPPRRAIPSEPVKPREGSSLCRRAALLEQAVTGIHGGITSV